MSVEWECMVLHFSFRADNMVLFCGVLPVSRELGPAECLIKHCLMITYLALEAFVVSYNLTKLAKFLHLTLL